MNICFRNRNEVTVFQLSCHYFLLLELPVDILPQLSYCKQLTSMFPCDLFKNILCDEIVHKFYDDDGE